jgi:hypothetical protein
VRYEVSATGKGSACDFPQFGFPLRFRTMLVRHNHTPPLSGEGGVESVSPPRITLMTTVHYPSLISRNRCDSSTSSSNGDDFFRSSLSLSTEADESFNSHTLKAGYVPGRHHQTAHEGCSCDQGITIGARVRHVKHCTSLGDGGINRQDTTRKCG